MNKSLLLTVLLLGSGVVCLADDSAINDTMSLEQEMDLVTTIAESETKDAKKDETKTEDSVKKTEDVSEQDMNTINTIAESEPKDETKTEDVA